MPVRSIPPLCSRYCHPLPPELARAAVVCAVQQSDESAERGPLVDGSQQLPSADEIGAQFEQFLAEQQGRTDSSDS